MILSIVFALDKTVHPPEQILGTCILIFRLTGATQCFQSNIPIACRQVAGVAFCSGQQRSPRFKRLVPGICGNSDHITAIVFRIKYLRFHHLPHVGEAGRLLRRRAGFVQSGHQHCRENRDNRDTIELKRVIFSAIFCLSCIFIKL